MNFGLGLNIHDTISSAGGGAAASSDYLDGVISSVCCDLDATVSASYSGTGQTWSNLISSPADGAGQTDYDFWLGADGTAAANDPTFTGSAGDPAAYFSFDGGDFFDIKSFSSALTLYNMHKSGASGSKWWIALSYRANEFLPHTIMGTGWTSDDIGLYMHFDPNGNRRVYRANGSALLNSNDTNAANDYADTDDVLVIVSADMTATTSNVKYWITSTTEQTASLDYGTFTTDNDNTSFSLGASYDTGTHQGTLASGARMVSFACGNEFIDATKAETIAQHLSTRHSRSYLGLTP